METKSKFFSILIDLKSIETEKIEETEKINILEETENIYEKFIQYVAADILNSELILSKYENDIISFFVKFTKEKSLTEINEILNDFSFDNIEIQNNPFLAPKNENLKFKIQEIQSDNLFLVSLTLEFQETDKDHFLEYEDDEDDEDDEEKKERKKFLEWLYSDENNYNENEYSLTEYMIEDNRYEGLIDYFLSGSIGGNLFFSKFEMKTETIHYIVETFEEISEEEYKENILYDSFEDALYESGPGTSAVIPYKKFPEEEYGLIDCRSEDCINVRKL